MSTEVFHEKQRGKDFVYTGLSHSTWSWVQLMNKSEQIQNLLTLNTHHPHFFNNYTHINIHTTNWLYHKLSMTKQHRPPPPPNCNTKWVRFINCPSTIKWVTLNLKLNFSFEPQTTNTLMPHIWTKSYLKQTSLTNGKIYIVIYFENWRLFTWKQICRSVVYLATWAEKM